MVTRFIIAFTIGSLISAESVQISVDKNRLESGELLKLNIQVINGEDFAKVDLGPLETDFEIVNGPSQQNNIQWTNGKMLSTKTLSWTLLPKRTELLEDFIRMERNKYKIIFNRQIFLFCHQ